LERYFSRKNRKRNVLDFLTGIDPDVLLITVCAINQSLDEGESFEDNLIQSLSNAEKKKYRHEISRILSILDKKNSDSSINEEKCIFNTKANSLLIKKIVENYVYLKEKQTLTLSHFLY
jgi:hypothetical protein